MTRVFMRDVAFTLLLVNVFPARRTRDLTVEQAVREAYAGA